MAESLAAPLAELFQPTAASGWLRSLAPVCRIGTTGQNQSLNFAYWVPQ